ncbi:hypothetical protein HDF16_001106 [Granulicella aggregans]|uniref:Uncharacterized protein n=1 Tax=Granulicella aggregans TaxID=474949 RepID=A0A7W7ZAP4_9BACT|nr:hypothetical protein [Granulicella aggregans]MBB5056421.1 hypothetical protein [Granulicella aggregans]
MEKTGTLKIANHESKVNGTLLARETDDQDEFGAATEFMINNNCDDGDCVTITGNLKGGVFWVDTAKKVDSSLCAGPALARAEFSVAVAKSAGRVPAKKTKAAKSATPKLITVPGKQKKAVKKASNKKGKKP